MVEPLGPDPLESAFQAAFREVASPRPDDAALLDDLVGKAIVDAMGAAGAAGAGAGATASGAVGAGAAAGATAASGVPLWIVGAGLGAVLLVGGVLAWSLQGRPESPARSEAAMDSEQREQPRGGADASEPVEIVARAPDQEGPERRGSQQGGSERHEGAQPNEAKTSAVAAVEPSPGGGGPPTKLAPKAVEPPTAAQLLSSANSARRAGEFEKAHDLYASLAAHHPESREAVLARVTHGKLLLDRLDRPKDALAEFDQYLRAKPEGTLAEEALAGRARAYRAMDRTAQELAAWRDLLDAYPEGVHAQAAKSRLGEGH